MSTKFNYVTVYIPDMEAALAFYQGLLGLKLLRRFPIEDNGEIAFLGEDGQPTIELIASPSYAGTAYSGFTVGVEVPDLDAATKLLADHGFPLIRGPVSSGPTRFSFFRDPAGIEVQLAEHR